MIRIGIDMIERKLTTCALPFGFSSKLIEGIEGHAFKEMLKDIHKRNFEKGEST